MTLYWNRLLAPKRRREKTSVDQTTYDQRSPFKKDFDTVCNSTILRRLQDKAQVFPLENEDYARTRCDFVLWVGTKRLLQLSQA